jgi:hypothetical protein
MNVDVQQSISQRRSGVGVHSLDHFSLAVPNLGVAATFYAKFGPRGARVGR